METADNPKLDLRSCHCEPGGLSDENMGTQKISVLDHINGFEYSAEKSDNFVIDMESFSHATNNKEVNPNSRITFQRSLSRKGSLRMSGRGGDKKINSNPSPNDRDAAVATSSPRVGPGMPEKGSMVSVGTADHPSSSAQVHHQITITTTNNLNASSTEGRCTIRRNSFKRPSLSWTIDPKRVLFFFATLSSMGTMLLIYFTLSIGKLGADDNGID
ncbi:uncharacterized protein LOC8267382 isoform X1 [Ricinus communis]|uniref:uncharacterized protein LOC8267382 isoform X1 n=1 Tax=Ricinus communis TaxID=3988 RepID=UPI00201AAB8C|nr:uncharacterized protein LOC8267382 isoform X1 [Ricinus communis]XP_015574296.2 uncharacterized protein LOC8267382 isoform X1 [Ricinus communis]